MLKVLLGVVIHLALVSAGRVVIPADVTVANLAWGFSNGGKDNVAGKQLVLVDLDDASESFIQGLKSQNHIVHCYFSVGTAEPWRPDHNAAVWDQLALGRLPQFGDEYWLDLTQLPLIKSLMESRFQRAKAKGCDAIEPDNTGKS